MPTSVDELVEQAAAGSSLAMGRLLMLYDAPLRQRIGRKLPVDLQAVLSAEDVLQDAYVEAYRHMGRFEPRGKAAFGHWLATITDHKLLDAIKAQRAAKRLAPRRAVPPPPADRSTSWLALGQLADEKGRTPSKVLAGREAAQAVQVALAALPESCRRALWMRYIEDKAVKDIAAALDRTEHAVHQLCNRGLALLRREMGSRARFLSGSE